MIRPIPHWKTKLAAYSSLIASRNLIFAGGDEIVVGLEATSGKEVWRHEGFIAKADLKELFAEKVGVK